MDLYNYTYPTELYHYGILGMRWGVRRYQNKDGTLTAAGKKKYAKLQAQSDELEAKKRALVGDNNSAASKPQMLSEDYARAHSGKSPKVMDTAELKELNTRLQQEKLYYETLSTVSKLTYKPTAMEKLVNVGKKALGDALTEWGTQTVKNVTKRALEKTLGKVVEKAMGIDEDKAKEKDKDEAKDSKT